MAMCYLDDVLLYTNTSFSDHLQQLEKVLQRLEKHNIRLKPSKCAFAHRQLVFLGFEIGYSEIRPMDSKVRAVQAFPSPTDVHTLRRFLGMTGYYSRMIPAFSRRALPLYMLLKKDAPFVWKKEHQDSFEDLRGALCKNPVLRMPDFNRRFQLTCDGSMTGLASCLSQEFEDGLSHPIGYASRTLQPAEANYSATEVECLAVVWSVTQQFRFYLYGREFDLITDHSALRFCLTNSQSSVRLTKFALKLQEYSFKIHHVPGTRIPHVDALSRSIPKPIATVSVEMKEDTIRQFQGNDPVFGPMIAYLKGKTVLPKTRLAVDQFFLGADGLLYLSPSVEPGHRSDHPALCLPGVWRKKVIQDYHENVTAGHLGMSLTYQRLRKDFYWKNQYTDVQQFIQTCQSCQEHNSMPRPGKSALQQFTPFPVSRMELVVCDIIGPWPETENGNRFIFLATDYLSRWPEAFPMPDQKAETVAKTFVRGWVARHGLPLKFYSDQGPQFTSTLCKGIMEYLGVQQILSTPFHHESLHERMNQSLENVLRHYTAHAPTQWDQFLDTALFALRTSVNSSTRETPAYLVYLRDLRVPYAQFLAPPTRHYFPSDDYKQALVMEGQVAFSRVREELQRSFDTMQRFRLPKTHGKAFRLGDIVFWKNPFPKPGGITRLQPRYSGPYRVVEILSPVTYLLQLVYRPSARLRTAHFDALRKGYLRAPMPEEKDLPSSESDIESSREPAPGSHSGPDPGDGSPDRRSGASPLPPSTGAPGHSRKKIRQPPATNRAPPRRSPRFQVRTQESPPHESADTDDDEVLYPPPVAAPAPLTPEKPRPPETPQTGSQHQLRKYGPVDIQPWVLPTRTRVQKKPAPPVDARANESSDSEVEIEEPPLPQAAPGILDRLFNALS
jgi:hypothetical protein